MLGPAFDVLRFFTTTLDLRAVDSSVFCHLSRDLLLQPLNPYHIISAATAVNACICESLYCLGKQVKTLS